MPRTGLTPAQLKEKAIDYAMEQMKQVGFSRVTLSDIAKSLGVSHAALYGHFADKAALFDAVTERWLSKFDDEQEHLCLEQEPNDAVKRIVQWFVNLHRMKVAKIRNEPELFKAFNYSSQTEKPFVKHHMNRMRRQLSTIVSQAMNTGLIKRGDVDSVVSLLFEGTVGYHHPLMVATYINEPREQNLRQLLETLIGGLKRTDDR